MNLPAALWSLLGLLVAILLSVVVVGKIQDWRFRQCCQVTTGVVVDLVHEWLFDGETYQDMHRPVVRFTLPDGRSVATQAGGTVGLGQLHVGADVDLCYDPERPYRVRLVR